jgi:hypothetical protein
VLHQAEKPLKHLWREAINTNDGDYMTAMLMIYIWLAGTVFGLSLIYFLLQRWYTEENFETVEQESS